MYTFQSQLLKDIFMFLFLILQLLNGTVEEMKAKSAADEWHLREGDGGYDKGQELLQDSTLQPVLSRPLLAAASAVESSTDTLVPETDVEERRKLYSSALRQEQHPHRCHAQIQDKQQPQLSTKHPPLLSVGTKSTRGLMEGNNSTTIGRDAEGRQLMMVSCLYSLYTYRIEKWAHAQWLILIIPLFIFAVDPSGRSLR